MGALTTLAKVNELKIKQFSKSKTCNTQQLSVSDLDICKGVPIFKTKNLNENSSNLDINNSHRQTQWHLDNFGITEIILRSRI